MVLIQLSNGVRFVVSSAGLILFCLYADHIIFKREGLWKRLSQGVAVRAVSDTLIHGVVGGWCWMNVGIALSEEFNCMRLLQILTSVAFAAVIDVDHMIEARSLSVKDALNLPKRPFAHNTTLILLVTAALYAIVYMVPLSLRESTFARQIPLMFFVASFSHHLRDADRRGLWIGPLFSTPAIPYKLYTLLIAVLPLATIAPGLLPTAIKYLVALNRTKTIPSDIQIV